MSKKVLRFTAPWCEPCKSLSAIIDTIENKPEIVVIDITKDKETAFKYHVRTVPVMVMLDSEIELRRMSGVKPKSLIEDWFNQ